MVMLDEVMMGTLNVSLVLDLGIWRRRYRARWRGHFKRVAFAFQHCSSLCINTWTAGFSLTKTLAVCYSDVAYSSRCVYYAVCKALLDVLLYATKSGFTVLGVAYCAPRESLLPTIDYQRPGSRETRVQAEPRKSQQNFFDDNDSL